MMPDDKNSKKPNPPSPDAPAQANLGGGYSLASVMHTGLGLESPFMREIYLRRQVIVGTRFQGGSDELVKDLKAGSRITFLHEPDNEFDPNAVMALDEQGRKLGYIPRRENELIAALMRAGKYFYGILTELPETNDYTGSKTPFSIWVDLYMREFARPGDLSEIPLQGYRGSYVVADFTFARVKGNLCLKEIYAIKVIHGEERGTFCESSSENERSIFRGLLMEEERGSSDFDPDKWKRMIRLFTEFAGHLPIVTFNIRGRKQECLEETCDTEMGKPFSNRIIDTLQMAENHLPEISPEELKDYADHLGICVHCDDSREKRCRMIWHLYCRMERSELENRKTVNTEDLLSEKYDRITRDRDILLSDLGLTERTRNILYINGIDTVREITNLSEGEMKSFSYMNSVDFQEIESLLRNLKTGFRPEKTDSFLYGYPEKTRALIDHKPEYWQYLFFMELIKVRYQWLQPLRNRHLEPKTPVINKQVIEDFTDLENILIRNSIILKGYAEIIAEEMNIRLREAFGEPDKYDTPERIYTSTDRLIRVYKNTIHWIEDFRFISVAPEYRKMIDSFSGIGEVYCSFYDNLYESCVHGIESIQDYLDGFISREEIDAKLDTKLELPEGIYEELLRVLEKELEKRMEE